MSLNILLPLSLSYNKWIKLLKRTKMSRLTLTSPKFPLQCEQKTVTCQKPVACVRLSGASPLLWKCWRTPGCGYLFCHPQQGGEIPAVKVSRDSRKRSGRGFCQSIYRKCVQFSLQNIAVVSKQESTWFFSIFKIFLSYSSLHNK